MRCFQLTIHLSMKEREEPQTNGSSLSFTGTGFRTGLSEGEEWARMDARGHSFLPMHTLPTPGHCPHGPGKLT